jgi:hypothetical protein
MVLLVSLGAVCAALAADPATPAPAAAAPATPATPAPAAPAPATNSLLIQKMNWVLSDMMRCIEELRNTEDIRSKRLLVEQVEEILYREVEFPLLYQQADNADALDVAPIGTTSDVGEAGEANPMATLYAEAFALAGIAKGYEGFAAAAADYMERAKAIYADVLAIQVKIDSFQDAKDLSQWIADARGNWGSTFPIRVEIYGKSVSQEVVDKLNLQNVRIQTDQKNIENLNYYLFAAQRDFLTGMRRRIATDDILKAKRINRFALYLPKGKYKLITGVSVDYANEVEVSANPNKNYYLIETIESGITLYPVPNVREFKAMIDRGEFEAKPAAEGPAETQEAPAQAEEAPAETEEAPAEADPGPVETQEIPDETPPPSGDGTN